MASMQRKFLFFILIIVSFTSLLFITSSFGNQTIFGAQTYTRQAGPPQIVTNSFSAVPGTQYRLIITNTNLQDTTEEMVSDSFVYLNGINIVGAHNFTQGTQTLEVAVELQENNLIEVEVRGNQGGEFSVQIVSVL